MRFLRSYLVSLSQFNKEERISFSTEVRPEMGIDLNKTDHILDHYYNRPFDFLPRILLPY